MPMRNTDLKNKASSLGTYQRGLVYQKNGRVTIVKNSADHQGERVVSAVVRGSGGNRYHVSMCLSADGGEVLEGECDCPAFGSYAGFCKHIVAAVLEAQGGADPSLALPARPVGAAGEGGPRRYTRESAAAQPALELLRRYAQRSAARVLPGSDDGTAELEPTLEYESGGPRLRFRIGSRRLYVLKDVAKFTQDMRAGAEVEYGKQFTFRHELNNFAEDARPLARYVVEQYHEADNAYFKYFSYYGSPDVKKYMILSPYMLDEFIKLYPDGEIRVERGGECLRVRVRAENPDLSAALFRRGPSGYVLKTEADLGLLFGLDRLYVLRGETLYCCDEAYSRACSDFLKTMEQNGGGLAFEEENMRTLVSTVLAEIKPFIVVGSDDDLSRFEPLPLVTKVYLDRPSANTVTAKMIFCYGEEKHNAFQPGKFTGSADLRGELYAEQVLSRYFPGGADPSGLRAIRADEDAVYDLLVTGVNEISGFAEVYASDSFQKIQVRAPAAARVGVRVKSGLLELDFGLDGLDREELLGVLQSYRQAKKYHRLRDGSFLDMEGDSLSELSELADGLGLSGKDVLRGSVKVPKYRALYLDSLMKQSESMRYDRDGEFKKIVRGMRSVSDADFEVPPSLKSTLRNYQKTGYRWLRTVAAYGFGGILADDMGLGKTVQVLALLLAQKRENPARSRSLVVCPSSLVLNWESEANRFAPDLHVVAVAGPSALRAELLQGAGDADLLVTSYDSLKRDVEIYRGLEFQYEIIDEAQYIKNHSTQNAQAVKAVKSRVRFALTGTPVENSLAELWSIYDFLMPGYLYSYGRFRKKLEMPIVRGDESSAAEKLRRLIRPFILRRLKKDVLKELPEKTETVLYAEMQEEQKKLYLANVALMKKQLEREFTPAENGSGKLLVLAMLTKLRQLCCDPSLLYEDYRGGSAKMELCMELVESCVSSGHRLLLFSQFTSLLELAGQRLRAADVGFYQLTGDTKPAERLAMVNEFNAGRTPAFLISLKAGGTGLNLTGADVVIHYDPWWNVSAQNQATDRAHRIGQKNSVQVYKLIAKDTVEEKILKMQQEKAALADQIIRGVDNALAKLSKEEILSLFE